MLYINILFKGQDIYNINVVFIISFGLHPISCTWSNYPTVEASVPRLDLINK
jgi:hypothetical protein